MTLSWLSTASSIKRYISSGIFSAESNRVYFSSSCQFNVRYMTPMASQKLRNWVPAQLITLVTLLATTNSKSYNNVTDKMSKVNSQQRSRRKTENESNKFQTGVAMLWAKNNQYFHQMKLFRVECVKWFVDFLTWAPNSSQIKSPSLILMTPMRPLGSISSILSSSMAPCMF